MEFSMDELEIINDLLENYIAFYSDAGVDGLEMHISLNNKILNLIEMEC